MRNVNMGPFWMIIAAVSVVALLVTAAVEGVELTEFVAVLKLVPTVAMIDGLVYLVFAKWLWRLPLLQGRLVPFPDLNGTWRGHIQSEWKDEAGQALEPIPATLTIKQSFHRLSCVMRTGEMESRSYAESFTIDGDDQLRKLCYTYTSRPKQSLRDRSTPHDGTVVFNILGTPVERLEGEYWTQRGTRGSITLTYFTSRLLESMPSDLPSMDL